MGPKLILAATAAALLLSACGAPDQWMGFVYPNKSDLTTHVTIGPFPTLESCRASAISTIRVSAAPGRGDYECGLNCKPSAELAGMNVCKRTER